MGREIRRVPIGFDWPLSKRWKGFENPHFKPCDGEEKTCFGGYTAAAKWLESLVRFIDLLGSEANVSPDMIKHFDERGRLFPHPYLTHFPQAPMKDMPRSVHKKAEEAPDNFARRRVFEDYRRKHPPEVLPVNTPELAELVNGLMGGPPGGVFAQYDRSYELGDKLRKLAGVDREDWGVCPLCKGNGIHPDTYEAYEAWQPEGPPKGEAWQMWETVSEGSPITPAFATKEGLIDHLTSPTGYALSEWGHGKSYSRSDAEAFVNSGWGPSGLIANGEMYDAVESAGLRAREAESTAEAEED